MFGVKTRHTHCSRSLRLVLRDLSAGQRKHFSKPTRPRPMILFDCCRSGVLTRTPIHFIPIPRPSPLLRVFLVYHSGPGFIKLIGSTVLIPHFPGPTGPSQVVKRSGSGPVEGNLFIGKWDAKSWRRQGTQNTHKARIKTYLVCMHTQHRLSHDKAFSR